MLTLRCMLGQAWYSNAFIFHCRGLDVEKFLKFLHVNVDMSSYKTASTLAVAYILHKVFLPVRAFVTISSVPFIVRFLRARGIMKPVPPKQPSVGSSWEHSNRWQMWYCVLLTIATTLSILYYKIFSNPIVKQNLFKSSCQAIDVQI